MPCQERSLRPERSEPGLWYIWGDLRAVQPFLVPGYEELLTGNRPSTAESPPQKGVLEAFSKDRALNKRTVLPAFKKGCVFGS